MTYSRKNIGGWLPRRAKVDQKPYCISRASNMLDDTIEESIEIAPWIILDQKESSSCVANAIAGAVCTQKLRGEDIFLMISRLQLYYMARRLHQKDLPLIDDGTFIFLAAYTCRKYGICHEVYWPFDLDLINTQPGYDAFTNADNLRGMNYYELPEEDKIKWMQTVLSNGYCFVFGKRISSSFVETDGIEPYDEPTDNGPRYGHAMYCYGYYRDEAGKLIFLVSNSWGREFGNNGNCRVTENFMKSAEECTVFFV